MKEEVIEKLAELEHEQWMSWAKSVYSEVSEERQKRWKKYFVPYKELPEEVKEYDRVWARKVCLYLERLRGGALNDNY